MLCFGRNQRYWVVHLPRHEPPHFFGGTIVFADGTGKDYLLAEGFNLPRQEPPYIFGSTRVFADGSRKGYVLAGTRGTG